MKRAILVLIIPALLFILCAGCVVAPEPAPRYRHHYYAPGPTMYVPPGPRYWVPGHYNRRGQWVPGHWRRY